MVLWWNDMPLGHTSLNAVLMLWIARNEIDNATLWIHLHPLNILLPMLIQNVIHPNEKAMVCNVEKPFVNSTFTATCVQNFVPYRCLPLALMCQSHPVESPPSSCCVPNDTLSPT